MLPKDDVLDQKGLKLAKSPLCNPFVMCKQFKIFGRYTRLGQEEAEEPVHLEGSFNKLDRLHFSLICI